MSNWMDKYEKRPDVLKHICLADFATTYTYTKQTSLDQNMHEENEDVFQDNTGESESIFNNVEFNDENDILSQNNDNIPNNIPHMESENIHRNETTDIENLTNQ